MSGPATVGTMRIALGVSLAALTLGLLAPAAPALANRWTVTPTGSLPLSDSMSTMGDGSATDRPAFPALTARRQVRGLENPWDVQTLPEYRRHHVAESLRAYRDRVLFPRGVREYVSSVQDDNFPALAYAYSAHRREGDRVGRVS